MQCEILYSSNKIGLLRGAIQVYLKTKNFDMFKAKFLRGTMPKETRFTLTYHDDLSVAHKSVIQFYEDLRTITDHIQIANPDTIPSITQLISLVETEFHIDADETQSASIETDLEVKTQDEVYDKNRESLIKHLEDIYGLGSFGIIQALDQDFYDSIIEAAYYNSRTGESVDMTPEILNDNIKALKQTLHDKLKTYLTEHAIPFKNTLLGVQQAFYTHVKSLDNLSETLNALQAKKVKEEDKINKNNVFKNLLAILEEDSQFNKYIVNKLNKYKKTRLAQSLYSGDCYSTSYLTVKKYVLERRPDLKSFIDSIEAPETNLLEAVNAYSILTHFDEMLIDKLGKQISIQPGTKNIDVPNKYSYHQDTAHEIKGWQTSEAIGSEKHISKFAMAVMSQIRIFDHKTDEYKNRRLDGTSFIVAARHLMDDILYGNVKIVGNSDFVKKSRDIILKDVTTFHRSPQAKLKEILQLLFDTTEGINSKPIKDYLTNKKLLTDHDLDILYSVYLKVFNDNDPTSFISQEISGRSLNKLGASLMQEMAAYVDSNITMDYLETSVDWETGEIQLKVKKKYFNNAQLYKLRKAINSEINNKSLEARKALQETYQLAVHEPASARTEYSVKVGDSIITLQVPNTANAKILTTNDKKGSFTFADSSIFTDLDKVDLIQLRQKIDLGITLDSSEQKLKQILSFIDDYLHLNILSNVGLQTLQVYKSTYSEINGMKNYLIPLVQLAIRAAYVNSQYVNAEDSTLANYLANDSIFKFYQANPKSKLFVETYGNVKYVVASFNDSVLDQWVDAISMLTGEASKATTKDGQGNNIPNNSVGKLGGILHYYLDKQKGTNCDSLMFVDNPSAIKSTFHDLEASNIHGDTKSIRAFSSGELFYHAIFNKFWGSYNKTGNVIVQPTVYSDKTTFLNWEISSILQDGTDIMKDPDYVSKVVKEYKATLGTFYANVYQETLTKLNTVAEHYNRNNGTNLSTVEVLKLLSENELIRIGTSLGLDLEKDKDYRARTKIVDGSEVEYCTINEILEYNARVYNDENLLVKELESEKRNFIQDLLRANIAFQVIDFNDDIEYYLKETIDAKASSKNAIITTILKALDSVDSRIKFFEEWVDAKTGRMILAKQNGRNILGFGQEFNPKETELQLNPFLDKFFYVEGLFSNNLRMSLTGSEINHPDKAYDTLFNTLKDSKKVSNYIDFSKETGIQINAEEFDIIKSILDSCDTVSDLYQVAQQNRMSTLGGILRDIYERSIIKIINTAQGTQFKRNVIIPATLQYCQQGTANGVTRKIKCAVAYDEMSPVNNYRGETKEIESSDGSAKINPFQSILENLSLGSQAVGFIKKPIWHSYDTSGGTAFLAKFATNTITNEVMRASLHSSTSSFRLFKRMTNMKWPEGIDLTKPIHMNQSVAESDTASHIYENWFTKVILEGQDLFYENQFGEKTQILMFNKTTTKDGQVFYYTLEKVGYGDPVKVYHMFDSESNHHTFDSWQKAQSFAEQGGHTIGSLFELQTALGGIYCINADGTTSEFNNKVVVNFMNNIGTRKEGVPKNAIVNQDNYYQPLKEYHIGYLLNNTAVKNGAKNINPEEAWKGDMDLMYFEVDSDGLGMQMNADHDIVNSELTEFSQVIAATAAYGYTYDNCNEIFKGLAKTALQASKRVIEAVNKFLQNVGPEAQSDLYDAVGRIIFVESSIKNTENLTHIIRSAVQEVFDKNKDHNDDSHKLPFSDPNIYNDFISTLASTITKSSIKRKHPGSGCVMAPGYNMITYFEIGDKKYSHKDMLKEARKALKTELIEQIKTLKEYNPEDNTFKSIPLGSLSLKDLIINSGDETLINISDAAQFNLFVVDRYLDGLQAQAPVYTSKDYFQPEDVVRIITPTGDVEQTIVLDSMEKYYVFKNRQDLPGTTYQVDIKTPRNLKPSLIRWRYNPTASLEELQVVQSEVYDKPWRDDPTQSNKAFTLSLAEDPTRKFEVVKDHEDGYWSVHFKTIPDGDTFESFTPLNEEQKARLFKAAADVIPVGDRLSTWGSLTPGGISGINRFKALGFTQVETREVTDNEGNPIQIPVLEKTGMYMNIFDHPVIKNAFEKKGKLDENHRKAVQQVLHDLHDGFFVMNGVKYNLIPNSLENTEAELVMSNIYKDTFGIENESLQEILDQGEQFFIDQIEMKLHAPVNRIYDVALLKDNGKHTLISFSSVKTGDYCSENVFTEISINEKGEIYCMRGNRELFKIGVYVDVSGPEANDLYIDNEGNISSKSNQTVDSKLYRISKGRIQKRIDFVKRYNVTSKSVNKRTGQEFYTTNTLYKIIDKSQLIALYGNEADAHKQIGSILTNIYLQDNYKFVELNPLKDDVFKHQISTIKGYFGWFLNNNYVNDDHKQYIQAQLDGVGNTSKAAFEKLKQLKKEFYIKEAHRKWVSFQDSLKFISSRIPAQTLQSFMAMKCVGWTENTKNMAYVSHFQTYLQGSDYDIDKAYIMGQSYDGNGIYIKWSPLFDYTDATTLALSKQLPAPESLVLTKIETGVDITTELATILQNTDDNLIPLDYDKRLVNLRTFISLLRKINKSGGNINHTINESPKLTKLFDLLYHHIQYNIPENVAEAAFKNVASANIYAVSHDIRNRDQSYTAITMKILKKAADASPKGEQAATLNMLNPLTKYVMQYQNLVGKNVISIAANGEKVWFNAYYYWNKLLKDGRPAYLQFQTTLSRIKGRAGKKLNQPLNLDHNTVQILPDLNARDLEIKNALLNEFDVDVEHESYAYVDQLISQLLSAATDNAKELILAKINSGDKFARMYVYLIMTGYNFDDIVSFMISPASEFIDAMSNSNMFQDSDLNNTAFKAIDMASGIVKSYTFLHGTITDYFINEETGDNESKAIRKDRYILNNLQYSEYYQEALARVGLSEESDDVKLDQVMQGFILLALRNPNIDLTQLLDTSDMEINTYLQYCQNVVYKLRQVMRKYSSLDEMLADAEEFKKIYNLASEISSIASAWLGLNQGLPTDELSTLKRFSSMRNTIIKREQALGIKDSELFIESEDPKKLEKARRAWDRVMAAILDNNAALTYEQVEEALKKAHEKKLIGTFDIYKYLTDDQYRKDMIEYNHIIKGTLNVLDMMEEIPHYKAILESFKSFVVSKQNLASKSRLISKLIQDSKADYLTDQQLRGIIRYVDKLNGVNFARALGDSLVLPKTIEGFNSYFEKINTDTIDLSTFEGMATFKHWVEHEFLEYLKANYADNPLIAHLQKVPENQRDILATDIDLLNPNVTSVTRQSYDDILRGMAEFEKVKFLDTGLTIADIFQLYNILVNSNQYGGERLTTTFKACSNPNSILNKYFQFLSEQDYAFDVVQDYELEDYYINAAPIVSTGSERFRTERFIKVNDPVEGYILKRYNSDTNSYEPYSMIPAKTGVETKEMRLHRLQNFAEFCPYEMPTMARISEIFAAINFDGEVTEDIINRIKNILLDFSSSGKLIVFKDC